MDTQETEPSIGFKIATAGIAGGIPAVLFGIMGANAVVDLAIAGIVGCAAWGFSPELQATTEKWVPKVKAANIPLINRVDWKGVFQGDNTPEAGNDLEESLPYLLSLPYADYLKTRHWQELRKIILKRDGYRCQQAFCEATDTRLDVHHLTYKRLGCELPDDLITYCYACHEALHGKTKEVRGEVIAQTEKIDPAEWINDLEGESFGHQKKNIFFFSELLATGWRPSWNEIFVGRTAEGENIFVPALDLCHVALAGKTGGGKGSLMRLIMVQLCYIGASVALLNPHYMRWVKAKEGSEFDEDWSSFEGTNPRTDKSYLQKSPVASAEMPAISNCLTDAVEKWLESRKRKARTNAVEFMPYFIVIDEWPLIVKKLGPRAPELLGYLLREGRKYRIYVIIASQDFQVKTLGCEGEGSVRKNFLTVFHTGGDPTTRRELMNEQTRETPENKIGKGVILMRCTGTDNECILAHVPFVDNASVYTLLGPSTYVKSDEEIHTDELEIPTTTGENGHEIAQNEVKNPSSSPNDWTEKEVRQARELARVIKDKDTIIRILEKRGTIAILRRELKEILQEKEEA